MVPGSRTPIGGVVDGEEEEEAPDGGDGGDAVAEADVAEKEVGVESGGGVYLGPGDVEEGEYPLE